MPQTQLQYWTAYRDKLREGLLAIASGVSSYSITSGNTTQNITRYNITEFQKQLNYAEAMVLRLSGQAKRTRFATILS